MSEWQIWKLVIERVATLEELEAYWSLDDVERAIASMSFKEELISSAIEDATKHGNST